MTFEKQVLKAKEEKLKHRILRDLIFIVLGITFLLISIIISYNKENSKSNDKGKKAYNNQILDII